MALAFANTFAGIAFGWPPGGPTIKKEGGLIDTWEGEILVATLADFRTLSALQRPTNRRTIANVRGFVDYWAGAASPIQTLTLDTADAGGTVTTETRLAILDHLDRALLHTDGSVHGMALFVATDLPAP